MTDIRSHEQWHQEAIPSGPFDGVPFDLQAILADGREWPDNDTIQDAVEDWLLGVLATAHVAVGVYDREVVRVIAEEGSTLVHVVAGWIARARGTSDPGA